MLDAILNKASEDDEFRNALIADAKSTIGKEFDLKVPDGLSIVVHEDDANTVHLKLPVKPEILDEGELARISGGGGCHGFDTSPW